MTEPTVRPTGGNGNLASKEAGGDAFAKVLDAERDAAEDTVTAAQPAPAPAIATTIAPNATGLEILAANATQAVSPATGDAAGAEDAFKAALANVAPAATAGGQPVTVADPAALQVMALSPTNPAPAAQATQAAGIAALLAAASGAATTGGKGPMAIAHGEESPVAGEASVTDLLAGLDAPQVTPAIAVNDAAVLTTATTMTEATNKAAALVGQAAPSPVAAPEADLAPTQPGDVTAQTDAQPKQSTKASHTSAPQAATPAGTQTQAPAAAAVDAVAKAAADIATPAANASAPQQANPLNASAQAPIDASRSAVIPPALQSAPAAAVQVYTRIIERADGRAQRFEVRLDPAELGRVDVRIEIGADRKVHAVLAAHDSAALSDLMRGQRALERALTGAGLDLADNGVRFELAADSGRGNANQHQANDGKGRSGQPNVWRNFEAVAVPVSAEAVEITTNSWRPQRLDLVA